MDLGMKYLVSKKVLNVCANHIVGLINDLC